MSNKRKIILLGKIPPPYMGTSVWFNILRKSKLKKYFNTTFFNINLHNNLSTLGKFNFKNIILTIIIYIKLFNIIKSRNYDLILIPISQTTLGFIKDSIFILLSKIFVNKVVVILHGGNIKNWLKGSSFLMNKYFEFCLRIIDDGIVLGANLVSQFNDFIDREHIHIVPNGLNINKTINIIKNSDIINILYLGNLQRAKGIIDVIKSLYFLKKKEISNFTLFIVGEWVDEDVKKECFDYQNKYNLPIVFKGPLFGKEKYDILAQSDIFVFTPKESEGLPLSLIEALASGLPIVTTNQGAIRECVIHNYNGFVLDKSSPKKIADMLQKLILDNSLRNAMSVNSSRHYAKNFTEEIMIDNYIKTFNTIIKNI